MINKKDYKDYDEMKKDIDKQLNKDSLDNRQVILSNKLAREKSAFTLEEEQLLFCVLSYLDPYRKNPDRLEINKVELFEKLGMSTTTRYRDLKKRFESMAGKTWVDIANEKGETFGFVITTVYSDYKSDVFEVDLNPRFMPYIQELATHYTKLELDSVVQFDSKYSLILYKYLASWRTGEWENFRYLTTRELKELFGLDKEAYVSAKGKFDRFNFEKFTINTAMDEINAKVPNIRVDYSKRKRGNRIQAYVFEVIDLDRL